MAANADDELREDLERWAQAHKGFHCRRSTPQFVLEFGRSFSASPLAKKYKRGTPRMCFDNSLSLALKHDLIFVEGYAAVDNVYPPIHHAWCVSPKAPAVAIDCTTKAFSLYLGVPFKMDFAAPLWQESEYASLLDDWRHGWPLLCMEDPSEGIWQPGGQ